MTPEITHVLAAPLISPDAGRIEIEVPAGLNIAEIVHMALPGLDPVDCKRCRVALVTPNGTAIILPDYWKQVRPRPGVRVVIRLVPGKDALRSVLQIVVSIAAVALSAYFGPLLAGTWGLSANAWTGLIGLGVNVLGNLLINALIPPIKPDEAKPHYTLSGWRNRLDADGAVPVVLGEMRYSPSFAAMSYTEIVGDLQYVRALFNFGYGPLSLDDFRLGETSLAQFDEVEIEVRDGLTTDLPISLYPRQIAEEAIGVELTRPLPRDDLGEVITGDAVETPITRTTGADAAGTSIILGWPAGLLAVSKKGKNHAYTVEVRIEQRLIEADEWQLVETLTITAKKLEGFFRQHTWDFPMRGRWQVRLTMMTDEYNSNRVSARTSWVALQTIRPEYPLNFPEPLALVGLRIKATHQLNGQLDNFNARAKVICLDWDYERKIWIMRPTSNVASIYRYVLQSKANPRPVQDAGIDLAQLVEWHDFCRIKGLKYDRVLDRADTTLRDILLEVTAAGRASPRHDGNLWGVTIDRPQELIVDHFSPRNSWQFKSQRSYVDPPDGFRVKFLDASNEYQSAERLIPWPGHAGPILVTEALELPGKTDPDEIWIEARRRMYEAIHRPDSYQIMQDGPVRVATRGDQIMLSHDVLDSTQIATRVKTVCEHIIEIDDSITMRGDQTYAVRFRVFGPHDDTIGNSVVRRVLTIEGTHKFLTLSGEGAVPKMGDLIHFGERETESRPLIVAGVEAAKNFTNLIHLIDAAPIIDELTDADDIPAWSGRVGVEIGENLQQPSAPRYTSIVSGIDGTGDSNRIDFLIAPGSGVVGTATYEINHRLAGSANWAVNSIPAADGGGTIMAYTFGDSIEIRARSISPTGVAGPYNAVLTFTIGAGDAGIPEAIDAAAVSFSGSLGGTTLTFATSADPETSHIQIYRSRSSVLDRETDATGAPIVVEKSRTYFVPFGDATRSNLLAEGVWNLGTGWALSGSIATHLAGTASAISKPLAAQPGKFYRLAFEVANVTAGSVVPKFTGGSDRLGTLRDANGAFVDRLQAVTGNDTFEMHADAAFDGSLDQLVLYLETSACLASGAHYFWVEPQNENGIPGPVAGPFTVSIR